MLQLNSCFLRPWLYTATEYSSDFSGSEESPRILYHPLYVQCPVAGLVSWPGNDSSPCPTRLARKTVCTGTPAPLGFHWFPVQREWYRARHSDYISVHASTLVRAQLVLFSKKCLTSDLAATVIVVVPLPIGVFGKGDVVTSTKDTRVTLSVRGEKCDQYPSYINLHRLTLHQPTTAYAVMIFGGFSISQWQSIWRFTFNIRHYTCTLVHVQEFHFLLISRWIWQRVKVLVVKITSPQG